MSNSKNDPMALEELSLNDLHFDDSEFRDPRLGDAVEDQSGSEQTNDTHSQSKSILERLKSITSVSEIMRIFGASAVIASMSLFMLKDWGANNDTQRYILLLGQTGLLTAAGIALSFILKEFKGARVFFGLALVSVVANFTILGSLLYSIYQLDSSLLSDYPAIVAWKVESMGLFLPALGFALVALPILTRFGMSIFARRIAVPLTIGFLALNSLLLVPARSSLAISALVAVAFLAAAYIAKRLSHYQEVVLTPETKFALGSLFIPGFILVARSLSLYTIDAVLSITLSGLAYFAIRSLLVRTPRSSFIKRVVEIAQYGLSINIALQIIDLIPNTQHNLIPGVFSGVIIALVTDQIVRSENKEWRTSLLNMTVIGLVAANILLALASSDLVLKLISLAICGGLILFSQKSTASVNDVSVSRLTAIFGSAISLVIVAIKLIALLHLGNWIVIGLIGMLLIIAASFYERYGLKLMVTR
jgi:hypothetical protein